MFKIRIDIIFILAILIALYLRNDTVESKMRVCVIGSGAAGLCAVRHLARDPALFEILAFEQTDGIGGTWVYTDEVDPDPYNISVHTSMYKSLRTNLPGELMSFPDFRWVNNTGSSILSQKQVLEYLQNYAELHRLTQHFQFRKKVEKVTQNENKTFTVLVRNFMNGEQENYVCDAVIVCNGHYSQPHVPFIPGIETFPGKVMHSHSYRKPDGFNGKSVILLGASYSGIDISRELSEHADRVYLSHNKAKKSGEKPPKVIEVAGIESVSGNVFKLRDGSLVNADVLIFCTGYNYSFPFLDEKIGIQNDGKYVRPLYKHLININNPQIAFIGIPFSVVPFPLFDMQVQYYLAFLKEQIKLPSKSEMLQDSVLKKEKKLAHQLGLEQWDYNDDLASTGGFQPLPPYYRIGYLEWLKQRENNMWSFKDSVKFVLSPDEKSVTITY